MWGAHPNALADGIKTMSSGLQSTKGCQCNLQHGASNLSIGTEPCWKSFVSLPCCIADGICMQIAAGQHCTGPPWNTTCHESGLL